MALLDAQARAQSRAASSHAITNAQQKASLRGDPKCTFLRSEYKRVTKESQDFADASPFGRGVMINNLETLGATVDQLAESVAASEEFAARLTVLGMKMRSCERGELLSSQARLPLIDGVRRKHVARAKTRWAQLGGGDEDPQIALIAERVNAVYDNEAKSFYNSDSVRADLDPDVLKDYPDLISLIQGSSLPPEQKRFLTEHSRFIKYEEAGRLCNILSGTDPEGSLSYAYTLRVSLAERANQAGLAAQSTAAERSRQAAREREEVMTWLWAGSLVLFVLCGALVVFLNSKKYAKYKAIRDGRLLMPYWFGRKKLVFWEAGDAVVLMRDKKLMPMGDPTGGYISISTWKGEEYKGRITYKEQHWEREIGPIHTSDGIPVKFRLGIGWHIQNPNTYISRIAADYHLEDAHEGEPRGYKETMDPQSENYYDKKLIEAAEKWIELLGAGTLREHICQLSVAELISPYIRSYIDQYFQLGTDSRSKYELNAPRTLENAHVKLNEKTAKYGISIENLVLGDPILPPNLEQKLQTVRLSFLEPTESLAKTQAKTIEQRGLNDAQIDALRGLATVIGGDKVAAVEFMKAIGLAKIPFVAPYAPPFSMLQSIFPGAKATIGEVLNDFPRQPIGPAEKVVEDTEQGPDETENSSDPKSEPPESGAH